MRPDHSGAAGKLYRRATFKNAEIEVDEHPEEVFAEVSDMAGRRKNPVNRRKVRPTQLSPKTRVVSLRIKDLTCNV